MTKPYMNQNPVVYSFELTKYMEQSCWLSDSPWAGQEILYFMQHEGI